MLKEAILKLTCSQDLDRGEAQSAMEEIMEGSATQAQIGAFLAALSLKGETAPEVVGFTRALRARARLVRSGTCRPIDVCGTGGDSSQTFNVSTTSSFVIAAAGVPVAKHGNRSVSSRCGSADVLEALGINIQMGPGSVEACLAEAGIGFMFAPLYHPAMKNAAGPRKELGFRTVFNLLGPLCNPAGVKAQVVGVYAPDIMELIAHVLQELGAERALVIHSFDGLDEFSISAPTRVCEVNGGSLATYVVEPGDVGLQMLSLSQVAGGDSERNAAIARSVLRGDWTPFRDLVLLNAAAGLLVGGGSGDLAEGVDLARQAIDSGAAWDKYQQVKRLSWELG